MTAPQNPNSSAELRRRLNTAHGLLLDIHKALLEHERVGYERSHGKIGTQGEFLQRLINDPFFAWLQPMTALIVQIDEFAEGVDPLDAAAGQALLAQTQTLLTADENGTEFQRAYSRALQESPRLAALQSQWQQAHQ